MERSQDFLTALSQLIEVYLDETHDDEAATLDAVVEILTRNMVDPDTTREDLVVRAAIEWCVEKHAAARRNRKDRLVPKPDCYACIHRRDLVGDAHSRCAHPSNAAVSNNPLAEVLAILGSVGRGPGLPLINSIGVTGDPHGIRRGWFNWPLNFDQVWLLTCEGFEGKENS